MLRAEIAKDVTDPRFISLYSAAFPETEKIPLRNLRRTFGRGGILRLFFDNDRYVGLCYTFEVNGVIFLVYLAVRDDLRSLGYGSEILEYMASEKKNKKMFLVVEQECGTPAEIKLKHRRKEFYRRNGWKDTGCKLLSDGYYFDSMYLDNSIPEEDLISTIKYYEEVHTGAR